MNPRRSIADPSYSPADERADRRRESMAPPIPPPPGALKAQRCKCEKPVTYRDEDSELRCTCGRAV